MTAVLALLQALPDAAPPGFIPSGALLFRVSQVSPGRPDPAVLFKAIIADNRTYHREVL